MKMENCSVVQAVSATAHTRLNGPAIASRARWAVVTAELLARQPASVSATVRSRGLSINVSRSHRQSRAGDRPVCVGHIDRMHETTESP